MGCLSVCDPGFRSDGICSPAQQAHYLHSVQMSLKLLVRKNIKGRHGDLLSSTNERSYFLFLNVVTKYVEPNKRLLITNSSENTARKRQPGLLLETQRRGIFCLFHCALHLDTELLRFMHEIQIKS